MPPALSPQSNMLARSTKLFAGHGRHIALTLNACLFIYVAYWLSDKVSYRNVLDQLRQTPVHAILVAMAMNAAVLTLYGLRLAAILQTKPLPCFLIANVGFTLNSLIPFRVGEAAKIYVGGAYFGFPLGSLGAAVVIEKLYDLLAVVALALIVASTQSPFVDVPPSTPLALALILVPSILLLARFRPKTGVLRPSEWKILKSTRLESFVRQAETLLAHQSVPRAALCTALIWTMNVCLVLVLFRTIFPEIDFGVLSAMTLLAIGALAIAVPASPAGLGVFEAGIVAYLTTAHGVSAEKAISAALAYHLSITAPHTAIAFAFLVAGFPRFFGKKPADSVRGRKASPR
ncbi:flippase-like domain-containing protein [Methylocystis sp. MJC1]|jgi:hypothetical protein|uniref:lysylphosphatidylglycerol synthase transmembrane domain-containing protein n=1 Tax=Methylocystis sp. MJC1 TaxID=2654282 RepID=UPI0013EBA5C4|nr:lysylphosphatidylglycerol synthase transmembrane domain-containing protein [Methylocystis sp. MJC1]KAF2991330.1 hypothetical protein MJC1_01679 [Methylocystis sp. MJC1]MBU6526131.1 flippase-like domain-containing protein [Methylocystis sp. MJC1]UZX12585.1 flippase-like domain-containing protein [Methylocystis sp. MJC1]